MKSLGISFDSMHCDKNSLWDWYRGFLSIKRFNFVAWCFLFRSANVGVIRNFWSSFKLSKISVAVDASLTKIAGLSSSSLRRFEAGLLPWLVLSFSFLKVSKIVADWYSSSLLCLIVEGRGSNKMHQGGNFQDFLKWEGACF